MQPILKPCLVQAVDPLLRPSLRERELKRHLYELPYLSP
jgi:hypothetical protein